jgi:hypothetical protein
VAVDQWVPLKVLHDHLCPRQSAWAGASGLAQQLKHDGENTAPRTRLIDRLRLARYVVWAKNWMGPWSPNLWEQRMSWKICSEKGVVPEDRRGPPVWLSTWLLIIADNTLHLAINYAALKYL